MTIATLIEKLQEDISWLGYNPTEREIIKHIKCAITLLEEQEPIRCKDCKWWHESETHKGYGDCGQANGIALKSSNWYCADGERRTDDA